MIGNMGVMTGNVVTTAEIVSYLPLTYFIYINLLYRPIFIFWPICPIFAGISSIVWYFEKYETKVFQYWLTGQYDKFRLLTLQLEPFPL